MKKAFYLPSWMSPAVAHSHKILLRLAKIPERKNENPGYFLNIEQIPEIASDIPNNRWVRFGLELDEEGNIKE